MLLNWLKSLGGSPRCARRWNPIQRTAACVEVLEARTVLTTTVAPAELLIYYGYPSLINGSNSDIATAAGHFSAYDDVVLGAGLEKTSHADHTNTVNIIAHSSMANTRVFGYIDLGVKAPAFNYSIAEVKTRIDEWKATGAQGIFFDDFGYDFETSRARQNEAVSYARSQGMLIVANAFHPEDAFGNAIDAQMNPTGTPSVLNANDIYLYESFQVRLGEYDSAVNWQAKSATIENLQKKTPFKVWTVTTLDTGDSFDQTQFDYSWYSALIQDYDAAGWGELYFSAGDNSAPFRTRPAITPGEFYSSEMITSGASVARTTQNGKAFINTTTHASGFEPSPEVYLVLNGINALVLDGTYGVVFETTLQGDAVEKTFTLSNVGTAPLILQPITVPSGFEVINNFTVNQTLAVNTFTTFTVRVPATTTGQFAGQLEFLTNDFDEFEFNIPISANVTVLDPDSEQSVLGDWILRQQYTDPSKPSYGGIRQGSPLVGPGDFDLTTGEPAYQVTSYFADLAISAAMQAGVAGAVPAARLWIEWYLRNMDENGFIQNYWYTASGDAATPKLSPHSVISDADDSAAAMILRTIDIYIAAGGDTSILTAPGVKPKLEKLATVMLDLQQPNGLTWAKVVYPAMYLADNSEVFAGFRAISRIEQTVYSDSGKAAEYAAAAERVRVGIQTVLYNTTTGLFRTSLFGSTLTEFDATPWYPAALITWPALFGVIDPQSPQAQAQVAAINQRWNGSSPVRLDWTTNHMTDAPNDPLRRNFSTSTGVALGVLMSGDESHGLAHATWAYGDKFLLGRLDPVLDFTVADAGFLLLSYNLLDGIYPTSQITALPSLVGRTITVSWTGTDSAIGSGIAAFDIYVSDNGGPITPWLMNTTATSGIFTGQYGHHYAFYSKVRDQVGNWQFNTAAPVNTEVFAAPQLNSVPTLTTGADFGAAQIIAPAATITAPGGFTHSQLAIQITVGDSVDQLSILPAGPLTVSNGTLSYSGTPIGTSTGGTGTSPLQINFNAAANQTSVQAVLNQVALASVGSSVLTDRTVTWKFTDHVGGQSELVSETVRLANRFAPVFTSAATMDVNDGQIVLGTVTATDADNSSTPITFAINGGADAALFTISAAGVLKFLNGHNTLSPQDVGANNMYEVTVVASDNLGLTTSQDISVTVHDTSAPNPITPFSPASGAVNVLTTANLQFSVSEPVFKGTGQIVIKRVSDDSVIQTIDVNSPAVTIASHVITINPADLPLGTEVYVVVPGSTIQDAAGNYFIGITTSNGWHFTTATDMVAPTLNSVSPADNATEVYTKSNLQLVFSEPVTRGSGDLFIKKSADNSLVQTVNSFSNDLTFSGATVTLNPHDFLPDTSYYVEVPDTFFQDQVGHFFSGISGTTAWNFTTSADASVPVLTSISPLHNATSVNIRTDIKLGFHEAIAKGTGDLLIRNASSNALIQTINVSSPSVAISGNLLTIDPADLAPGVGYYVEIPPTAITDLVGNRFIGITGNGVWNFTTSADVAAPVLTYIAPLDNATGVLVNSNIELAFSESVVKGSGSILIKRTSDNSTAQTINVQSSAVKMLGATVLIDPADLVPDTGYYIEVPTTVFTDLAGNPFIGIVGPSLWNFTTTPDGTAPLLNSISPLDNATGVNVASKIVLGFQEPVTRGTGNILIRNSADQSIFQSLSVTSSAVFVAGSTVTITPNTLAISTGYYVEVPGSAIRDLAGNSFIGIAGPGVWNFTTSDDATAPVLTAISPLDNQSQVNIKANILLGFHEPVTKGTGNILIRKVSDNSVAQTIDVLNPAVSISGSLVTINPADFATSTSYYIEVPNTAILDFSGNRFIGIAGPDTWNFTTSADATVPVLTSISPVNNATGLPITTNIQMGFNEAIQPGTGSILIKRASDNSTAQAIPVTSPRITFSGNLVIIDPVDLAPNTSYYMEVPPTAIRDLAENAFIGIVGPTLWRFTTTTDTSVPVLTSISPLHLATNVSLNTNIVLGFHENVFPGTGSILIRKSNDQSIVQSLNVLNPAVSFNGSLVTINPADLAPSTSYYVEIPNTAIRDQGGNAFIGVSGPQVWSFTTGTAFGGRPRDQRKLAKQLRRVLKNMPPAVTIPLQTPPVPSLPLP